MQVIEDISLLGGTEQGTAVALGNFDGVHLGHREIFRTLTRRARELGVRSVVYTFEPHPLKVLAPDRAPLMLNTPAEKERLIRASNVDILARIPFSTDVARQKARDFVRLVLVEKLHVRALVIGYDFAFGHDREGNGDFLLEQAKTHDFSVDVLQPVGADGQPYSSTRVRELLNRGEVEKIPAQLGRHYTLGGMVVGGDKRGRLLGYPTANLRSDKEQLPAHGVYAVMVRRGEYEYQGVVNIGCRPTYGAGETTIEVFLFDFEGDLYGEELRLYFVSRLREERSFVSSLELKAAIKNDVALAREVLTGVRIIQYQEYLAGEI